MILKDILLLVKVPVASFYRVFNVKEKAKKNLLKLSLKKREEKEKFNESIFYLLS